MTLIGDRWARVEDGRLVTGHGMYAGDDHPAGLCHMAVLRSPYPHARIVGIDVARAGALPGVLALWTAADLGELPATTGPSEARGPQLDDVRIQPLLAGDELCHEGQAFGVAVASSPEAAADALAAVEVDLEPLAGVGDPAGAVAEGAATAHDGATDNVAGRSRISFGSPDGAFAAAPVTVRATLTLARIVGAAMEPRTVMAAPQQDGTLLLRTSTQAVFSVREAVARALGEDPARVRVLAEDVGGGFGAKGGAYPEEVLVAMAARRLGRPVRWVATRSEDGATTNQSHGTHIELELAAGRDGRVRGLRGRLLHNLGAFAGSGAGQAANIAMHLISAYRLPALQLDLISLYTNTAPTGFIRGGGREVGNFAIERLMDRLGDQVAAGRDAVRARNLLRPGDMPYDTRFPIGEATVHYDLGDVPAMLARVRELLTPEELGVRGSLARGMGIACYAESTGFGSGEPARLRIGRDGIVQVAVGSTPQGQGHETMVGQVVGDRLGWPADLIRVVAGDTAAVSWGMLTAGSRSAVHVGNAASGVALEARRRLLELGAEALEADAADLSLHDGVIEVKGAPSRQVEARSVVPEGGIEATYRFEPARQTTWASGCHGVVVEVDLETCRIDVVRSVMAHDSGRLINPMLAEGQLHGGLAHGIGYALFEDAGYERDGTMRAPSFLDYAIVSAPEMAARIDIDHNETLTPANPEGFRGIGEAGAIPVPAAICSAVEDALRRAGLAVDVTDIPLTSDRLFQLTGAASRR